MAYKGWDVHAYTQEWLPIVKKHKAVLATPIGEEEFKMLLEHITKAYAPNNLPALTKMARLYHPKQGGYLDSQFDNINVARLLAETWAAVKHINDSAIFNGFKEILVDVGTHCVQGDSHRLFAYWIAITRSGEEK